MSRLDNDGWGALLEGVWWCAAAPTLLYCLIVRLTHMQSENRGTLLAALGFAGLVAFAIRKM